jgi:methionyl-tRNA formyltransferase
MLIEQPMRVVFMGTPEFAIPTLLEISRSGLAPIAVYTRAPAQRGRRGLELRKAPVHLIADSLGIPVFTPTSLRDAETQNQFQNLAADLALVIAYGLLLPIPILKMPRLGCLNLHASLLPRWRGAAPIQRAIMAGDHNTGVDAMRMDAGLDTGPVAMRESIAISPDDTAGDLANRLASVAAQLAVRALRTMEAGFLGFREQSSEGISYAHKIKKSEADIDWAQNSETVRNQIHGLSPWPGAFSRMSVEGRDEQVKFLRARVATGTGFPGTLLTEDMRIACGDGAIEILEVQRPSRSPVSGRELVRGARLPPGVVFERSHVPSPAARLSKDAV